VAVIGRVVEITTATDGDGVRAEDALKQGFVTLRYIEDSQYVWSIPSQRAVKMPANHIWGPKQAIWHISRYTYEIPSRRTNDRKDKKPRSPAKAFSLPGERKEKAVNDRAVIATALDRCAAGALLNLKYPGFECQTRNRLFIRELQG